MDPVVIEFTERDGKTVYEMGMTIDDVLQDTRHGCPVEMKDVASYKEVPLTEARELFDHTLYQKAYDCVTDPAKQNVYFMGSATQQKPPYR